MRTVKRRRHIIAPMITDSARQKMPFRRAIIDENTLSDDASNDLKNIRKSIRFKEQEIMLPEAINANGIKYSIVRLTK